MKVKEKLFIKFYFADWRAYFDNEVTSLESEFYFKLFSCYFTFYKIMNENIPSYAPVKLKYKLRFSCDATH